MRELRLPSCTATKQRTIQFFSGTPSSPEISRSTTFSAARLPTHGLGLASAGKKLPAANGLATHGMKINSASLGSRYCL